MKLLITSDWHADARTLGHARFSDVDRAVLETVSAAFSEKVDLYCFLGDLCDPDAGSAVFRSVELAISAALTLHKGGIPSVWIAGNHDVIEDGSGDTTLSPLRPLANTFGPIHLFERPGDVDIGDVRFHLFPYVATSHAYDPRELASKVWGQGGKHIVLAHLAVAGVQPGEETADMPRGRDVLFPREEFTSDMNGVHLFNGHYHRQQVHELPGFLPVHIPGAPARFTFGEADHEPGYLIVEV